jgi:hypothetical protein
MLAEHVNKELETVRHHLESLTQTVNANDAAARGLRDDPMSQLEQVLDEHMTALQWVEDQIKAMRPKVHHVAELTRPTHAHRY